MENTKDDFAIDTLLKMYNDAITERNLLARMFNENEDTDNPEYNKACELVKEILGE